MPRHTHRTDRRPVTTIIRMGASHSEVTTKDQSTGEVVTIPLTGLAPHNRESLAVTLCELHGIGTRRQWGKHGRYLRDEAANRRRKAREEHAAVMAEREARELRRDKRKVKAKRTETAWMADRLAQANHPASMGA